LARVSVRGKSVTVRARIDLASTFLASNVPNASDGVAVRALTESGTTATVVEVDKGINALVITADQAGNRASRETLRARCKVAGAEVTLLGSSTLVVIVTAGLSIVVALTTMTVLVIIITGGLGRGRGVGGGRTAWGRVATK
jgi:hypothetical protein